MYLFCTHSMELEKSVFESFQRFHGLKRELLFAMFDGVAFTQSQIQRVEGHFREMNNASETSLCQIFDLLYVFLKGHDFVEPTLDFFVDEIALKYCSYVPEKVWPFSILFLKRLNKAILNYSVVESGLLQRWLTWLISSSFFVRKCKNHYLWFQYLRIILSCSRKGIEIEIVETLIDSASKLDEAGFLADWNLFCENEKTFFAEEHLKTHLLLIAHVYDFPHVRLLDEASRKAIGVGKKFDSLNELMMLMSSHDGDLVDLLSIIQKAMLNKSWSRFYSLLGLPETVLYETPSLLFESLTRVIGCNSESIIEFLMDNLKFLAYFTEFIKYLESEIVCSVTLPAFQLDSTTILMLHEIFHKLQSYTQKNIFPYNPKFLIAKMGVVLGRLELSDIHKHCPSNK